ncbi:unnamed protein product, partial [Urochloa humidicola]
LESGIRFQRTAARGERRRRATAARGEEKPRDGGAWRRETRDGGAGREGASETRSWRSRSDDPAARVGRVAARGNGVAARHILDGVDGLLPFFVSLRRLLTDFSSTNSNWGR